MAYRLSNVIVDLNRGHNTTDGLAVVLSIVFSNFLTAFSWTLDDIPEKNVRHGPVRWQIYGSGPRLPWQWVTAAVIAVSIIVQMVDIFYILIQRRRKGPWLSLGGMLVAANAASRMPSIADRHGAGYVNEDDKFVKFYMRQKRDSNDTHATLVDHFKLLDGGVQYEKLQKEKVYGLE